MEPKKLFTVFLAFVLYWPGFFQTLSADENNNVYNKFSFALHGGPLISYTDVKSSSLMRSASESLSFGGGIQLNYHLSPVLTMHSRFLYGHLEGLQEKRNHEFSANIYEATLHARISLNSLFNPLSRSNEWMSFYTTLGAGVLMHESELIDTQTGDVIRWPYMEREGVSQGDTHSAFVIPFGLGLNFKVSERFDIGIESTMGYAFTDELDARIVKGSRKDMYNYTSIGLTFRLGSNTRSMDWAPTSAVIDAQKQQHIEYLSDQLASLRKDIESMNESLSPELESVKSEIDAISVEQSELSRRNTQISGALENLEDRLTSYEVIAERKTDTPASLAEGFYSVQLMAHKADISIEEARTHLKIDFEIEKIFTDGWYKFFSGRYDNLEDARLHMMQIWGQGVKDAFIVQYKNGTLIPR